jgi:hypothetical protein
MLLSIKFYKYRPFAVHFVLTVVVAMVCLGCLDGRTFNANSRRPQYQEADGSLSYAAFYAPLQSDITTTVSLAASVTRVAGGWWATGCIWRCIFVAMERGGISAKGVSQAVSSSLPVLRHSTRKSNMVIIYITLLATFAIDYFSAALTGSFVWDAADTKVPGRIPLTVSNRTAGYFIISSSEDWLSWILSVASASASVAWGRPQSNSILNIAEPSTTFRRVINGAHYISTNSTLAHVTMPYFAVDAFEWVRDPHHVLTDKQLSLLNQNASGYNPFRMIENGTGGLLPDEEWGSGPIIGHQPMPTSGTRPFTFRIWFSTPVDVITRNSSIPTKTSPDTIAPPCPQNYTIDPGLEINFISGSDYVKGRDCFAIANVSYRAGVISCQNCKIIAPNTVEAQAPFSLLANPYTVDALGMTPLIATTFYMSRYAIPLNYGTRRNLGIELTSRAYQATWAALADHSTIGTNVTTVQIALPTLRAKITHWRVYLWVALHLWVLALGLLFTYVQSHCDHPWVDDPTMAVFWLDTKAILTDSEGRRLSDPWQPRTEVREGRMLILEHNEAGQRSVQVKRDSGSHERRYSDSVPLRRRRPPSSSAVLEEESRESVAQLIGPFIPTSLQTIGLDATRTPEIFEE